MINSFGELALILLLALNIDPANIKGLEPTDNGGCFIHEITGKKTYIQISCESMIENLKQKNINITIIESK